MLVDASYRSEAEALVFDGPERLAVTWLHRLEIVNALQQCVFLNRQGMPQLRVTPELATAAGGQFFDEVELGVRYHPVTLPPESVEVVFCNLSNRQTAKEGFRTDDILHVASALVLGCDTFWSFDAKAKKLAKLEGLAVN